MGAPPGAWPTTPTEPGPPQADAASAMIRRTRRRSRASIAVPSDNIGVALLSLTLAAADPASLRDLYESQLSQGRAFLPGAAGEGVTERTPCELVIEHGARSHRLAAEVVFVKDVDPGCGVGLQLAPLDAAAKDALRAFVEACEGSCDPEAGDAVEEPQSERPAANVQERLRGISTVEQQRLAAAGTLTERVALERMYGPNVWEALLRNQRLTVPEVARIGRKGTLPRPLIDLIAANGSWMAAGEVQRALLSNPRTSTAVAEKVLRSMSRSDLQLVPQQTAYPAAVRQAAKRLLGR